MRKPKMTGKVWVKEEHDVWGNRISFTDFDTRRVSGHTTPLPNEGDELRCTMKSGKIFRFALVNVEYCNDPKDMWFADAYDIGYVGEKPINKVKEFKV